MPECCLLASSLVVRTHKAKPCSYLKFQSCAFICPHCTLILLRKNVYFMTYSVQTFILAAFPRLQEFQLWSFSYEYLYSWRQLGHWNLKINTCAQQVNKHFALCLASWLLTVKCWHVSNDNDGSLWLRLTALGNPGILVRSNDANNDVNSISWKCTGSGKWSQLSLSEL